MHPTKKGVGFHSWRWLGRSVGRSGHALWPIYRAGQDGTRPCLPGTDRPHQKIPEVPKGAGAPGGSLAGGAHLSGPGPLAGAPGGSGGEEPRPAPSRAAAANAGPRRARSEPGPGAGLGRGEVRRARAAQVSGAGAASWGRWSAGGGGAGEPRGAAAAGCAGPAEQWRAGVPKSPGGEQLGTSGLDGGRGQGGPRGSPEWQGAAEHRLRGAGGERRGCATGLPLRARGWGGGSRRAGAERTPASPSAAPLLSARLVLLLVLVNKRHMHRG